MKRFFFLFLFSCLANACFAQIKTTTIEKKSISGAIEPNLQGNRILIASESQLSISSVVVVKVETDFKFRRVKAYRDGSKVEAEQLNETEYLFSGAGKYLVDVTVFDPDKGIDDTQITFFIGSSPTPPGPEPGPQPKPEPEPAPPEGLFDNLAIRVAALSVGLTAEQKTKWNSVLSQTISKMKSFEFKRVDEARNFIRAANLPNANLNQMLANDAQARMLSFNETILWYQEVLRGLK